MPRSTPGEPARSDIAPKPARRAKPEPGWDVRPPAGDAPKGSARALLIATRDTLPGLRAQLAAAGPSVTPIGHVLVGPAQPGAIPDSADPARQALGGLDDLAGLRDAWAPTYAVVCLPSSMTDLIQKVRSSLARAGIAERFVPPIGEWLSTSPPYVVGSAGGGARVSVGGSGGVDTSELLGRTPYGLDRRAVARILTGKRVLITGAGGSIGSELARIAAGFGPELLVLMERSENALFEIDRQIARRFPGVTRRAVLHDVVDADRTAQIVLGVAPHAVFHAAAHKHVPLMEDHPSAAVSNNLFGTRSIADAALAAGAERFVLISSDKAVNPTSVMGATKRLAELYVHALQRGALAGLRAARPETWGDAPSVGTRFSIVRFGNVLASACSVVPIWTAQLAEGGPITVTDPRMTRYFMTIHEAATLVIQSAAIDPSRGEVAPGGEGAQVYVLDMGEPVRILDMAERFVRLHGLEPRTPGGSGTPDGARPGAATIDIVFTGVRPGEKLHEELAYAAEMLRPTPYPGINAWLGGPRAGYDPALMIADLSRVRSSMDRAQVLSAIRRHVPEMQEPARDAGGEGAPGVRAA